MGMDAETAKRLKPKGGDRGSEEDREMRGGAPSREKGS